jgi:hypothetical protein
MQKVNSNKSAQNDILCYDDMTLIKCHTTMACYLNEKFSTQ